MYIEGKKKKNVDQNEKIYEKNKMHLTMWTLLSCTRASVTTVAHYMSTSAAVQYVQP